MASEDLPANGHGGPADPARTSLRRTRCAARAAYVAGLSAVERDRLEIALAAVLDRHLSDGVVAAYRATGGEIDPCRIARVPVWPRVAGAAPLVFHAAPPATHRRGFAGILEPAAAAPRAVPDIVLVPLLAVDHAGHRLGHGGGHYDRTLAALRTIGRVLAVGVAWDMQVVDELPVAPWDQRLDALATPSGWRSFAPPPMSRR